MTPAAGLRRPNLQLHAGRTCVAVGERSMLLCVVVCFIAIALVV